MRGSLFARAGVAARLTTTLRQSDLVLFTLGHLVDAAGHSRTAGAFGFFGSLMHTARDAQATGAFIFRHCSLHD